MSNFSNPEKFPMVICGNKPACQDFAFQLTNDEAHHLQSQNATAISSMSRVNPWAYTLEGCNMAATVLNTPKAVKRSVQIIRTFSDLMVICGERPACNGWHTVNNQDNLVMQR
jgi:hypothetical protein